MYRAYTQCQHIITQTRAGSPLTYLNPYTRGFLIPIEHADDLANDKRDEAVEVEEVENQSYCDTHDSDEKQRREHGSWPGAAEMTGCGGLMFLLLSRYLSLLDPHSHAKL